MICVSIGESRINQLIDKISSVQQKADIIEIRFDYLNWPVSDEVIKKLISIKKAPFIATLRIPSHGGKNNNITPKEKLSFVKKCVLYGFDYVDIEKELAKDYTKIGREKVIVSYHNFKETPNNLQKISEEMASYSITDIVKIACQANSINDNFRIFEIIKDSGLPVIGICMGIKGVLSRIAGRVMGNFLTFASVDKNTTAPGQVDIDSLIELYRYKQIDESTIFFGVIANPVGHSLSPILHNTLFKYYNLNAVYLPLEVEDNPGDFVKRACDYLNFGGFSITIPHKQTILSCIDKVEKDAEQLKAINTLVISDKIYGYNTDIFGALKPLKDRTSLKNKKVLVLGAGGAARAIIYGLISSDAKVTVANRTISKAQLLSQEFAIDFLSLEDVNIKDFEIIINTTSVGMYPNTNASPIPTTDIKKEHIVFDIVYNPKKTLLLKEAEKKGATIITGVEMFVWQAYKQFSLWTSIEPSSEIMFNVMNNILSE